MIPAIVKSYDYKTKTATVVVSDSQPYELQDIPVWNIYTGDGIFNVPLLEGTAGMLMYCSIDAYDFFWNGEIELNTVRVGAEATPVFLPGWQSFIQDYDVLEDGILLGWNNSRVKIQPDMLTLESGDGSITVEPEQTTIHAGCNVTLQIKDNGKFTVTNATGEFVAECVDIIDQIFSSLTTPGIFEYVNTAGVVTPCTVNAGVVTALKAIIDPKLEKIKSFKA